jgi:RNA polymerase sigma-70 factor (ECF subfamily)
MGTQSDFLVSLAKSTGQVDFEAVYRMELPRIYNFFRYRLGDDQTAEDLTAETFEKAWRHRERYRDDLASFSTWLFTIARRVATDHFRKRRFTLPLDEAEGISHPQTLEDTAQERTEFAQLSVLLARLAERERELVALKYGAGLTNRAIARISGLSESNVSTILSRVTHQLRAQLENENE